MLNLWGLYKLIKILFSVGIIFSDCCFIFVQVIKFG